MPMPTPLGCYDESVGNAAPEACSLLVLLLHVWAIVVVPCIDNMFVDVRSTYRGYVDSMPAPVNHHCPCRVQYSELSMQEQTSIQ
eukprot:12901173-Prorocentrum_lima.AAC.1